MPQYLSTALVTFNLVLQSQLKFPVALTCCGRGAHHQWERARGTAMGHHSFAAPEPKPKVQHKALFFLLVRFTTTNQSLILV